MDNAFPFRNIINLSKSKSLQASVNVLGISYYYFPLGFEIRFLNLIP